MKTRIRTIYYCDHCNKKYIQKKACETHEKFCKKNPEHQSICWECKCLQKREVDVEVGDEYSRRTLLAKTYYCSNLNKNIHPRFLNTGRYIENEIITQNNIEPMPSQCHLFEKRSYNDEN